MSRARALGPRRAALLGAVIAVAALAAVGAFAGASDALAYLLPVLLLLGALALRCYPGERALLATIAARRRPRRREASGGASAHARQPLVLLARGGALIGAALAVRPPPRPSPVPGI